MSNNFIFLKNQENQGLQLRTGAIIAVNKPIDWTSFDVIRRFRIIVKKTLGIKKLKVGHTGTLDPKATGILILCTGRATKQIESLMLSTKEYITTIKLGATTPSFDTEHKEDKTYPFEHINLKKIQEVIPSFIGDIYQEPPLFSAISVNGERAYELARKGEKTKLKEKLIHIDSIEILDFSLPYLTLRIRCGKGTYIRSLARDLGIALDSGAYITSLERTKVENISIGDAFSIDEVEELIKKADLNEEGFPLIEQQKINIE